MSRAARMFAVAILILATGCAADAREHPVTPAPASTSADAGAADPNLITLRGIGDIDIGASMESLIAAGLVAQGDGVCGPTIPTIPSASPVFDTGRLVLIWAHPPLRTPERVMVGTPLAQARRAYPDAIDLTRQPGAIDFPALLVPGDGDRAYLLLHDGETVQKLVVGFEEHARRLFDTGFGSC